MDNNDLNDIILARSTDVMVITFLWGLTNYVDNEENVIYQIPIFGIMNVNITNKFLFGTAYFISGAKLLYQIYQLNKYNT